MNYGREETDRIYKEISNAVKNYELIGLKPTIEISNDVSNAFCYWSGLVNSKPSSFRLSSDGVVYSIVVNKALEEEYKFIYDL